MSESYKKILKLTEVTLLINGIRTYPCANKFWNTFYKCVYYINVTCLFVDVFAELRWLFEEWHVEKSYEVLSFIIPCVTISFLSAAKAMPLFYYQSIIMDVVEKLSKIHPLVDEKPLTDEEKNEIENLKYFPKSDGKIDSQMSEKIERKIVHDSTWLLATILRPWFYSCAMVVVTWSILPLLVMSYEYFEYGETSLKLIFMTKYFFDPFTKVTWPLVYLHQVWSTAIAGLYFFGADTFIYNFCMHVNMHFQILCHQFEFLVSDSIHDTKRKLKSLVKRHQELIDLVNQMEIVCEKSTLINYILSSVLICLCALNMTVSKDRGAVFAFCTLLVSQLSQISLLCFFGDLVMKSSSKVSDAIYKSRWYDLDTATKRSVFLILHRSQKPCKLTAAKFGDLNLSAFTTILSRSWSYFALLRTVYK